MLCTISMDAMGNVYVFRGRVDTYRKSKYYVVDAAGKDADLFLQEGMGAEEFLEQELTTRQKNRLNRGYDIQANIIEDYFLND